MKGLDALRQLAPAMPGNVGHMVWTISCMRATGEPSPGFVRRSEFHTLLNRANIEPRMQQVGEALRRAIESPLPSWMRRDAEGLLNTHQVATALAWLCCSRGSALCKIFDEFAVDGTLNRVGSTTPDNRSSARGPSPLYSRTSPSADHVIGTATMC